MTDSIGDKESCPSSFGAMAWIALWLACLIGLLAYLYASRELAAWSWIALLLMALFSPGVATFRKAFGKASNAKAAKGF